MNSQGVAIDKTLVERLLKFDKFICGWEPIEDVWFGGRHPDFKGAFWWRRFSPIKEAADTIEAQATRIEALEAALLRCFKGETQAVRNERILEAIENYTSKALESQP